MTKISSGAKKSGPPAHANKFAFIHNRNSKKTQKILAMPISGLCPQCVRVIEWRKKFRKYKPLSVAKKCVQCEGKCVTEAYHVICKGCATAEEKCAKCLLHISQWRNESLLDADAGNEQDAVDRPFEDERTGGQPSTESEAGDDACGDRSA